MLPNQEQERKLIRYVQKSNTQSAEDLSEKTNDIVEKADLVTKNSMNTILEDLIQDSENNKESKATSNDEDKDIEMLGIINDKQLSLNEKLCLIGDSIVFRLVEWTKKLPFYSKLPLYSITMLLTHKWHSLLVLTTCAYQVLYSEDQLIAMQPNCDITSLDDISELQLKNQTEHNMIILIKCLEQMMQMSREDEEKEDTCLNIKQLEQEAGPLFEALARVNVFLRLIEINLEEYVLLKIVILSSNYDKELTEFKDNNNNCKDNELNSKDENIIQTIHEQHLEALQFITEQHRYELNSIKVIQEAASILIRSKMFYVPYLLTMIFNFVIQIIQFEKKVIK